MFKKLYLPGLFCVMVLFACTTDNTAPGTNPTLDTSSIQTILPTIDPADVATYAQLADEATLTQGQEIYEANCASCHGINGEGQFPEAPLQADNTGRIGAPPHNGEGHTWHHQDDLLYEIVRFGGQGNVQMFYPMPAFGDILTEDDIVSVIAYIKTMWTEEQRLIQAERTLSYRANFP